MYINIQWIHYLLLFVYISNSKLIKIVNILTVDVSTRRKKKVLALIHWRNEKRRRRKKKKWKIPLNYHSSGHLISQNASIFNQQIPSCHPPRKRSQFSAYFSHSELTFEMPYKQLYQAWKISQKKKPSWRQYFLTQTIRWLNIF